MKLKAFCCFYNEAALIPFFLSHYHFVDTIHAIVSQSTDDTRALLEADPRVTIQDAEMPNGMDDDLKVAWINAAIAAPDPDHEWHLVVDADEFFWTPGDPTGRTVKAFLSSVPADCDALMARMDQVYRHASERDLDPSRTPVALQRRHGTPLGAKPAFLRSNVGLQFTVGNHGFVDGRRCSTTLEFVGAHWQNADPSFAIPRRVRDRSARLSETNKRKGYGSHQRDLTAANLERELAGHLYDAQLF